MMKEIEIQILRTVSKLTSEEENSYVDLQSIDRRILLIDPKVIYSGKLIDLLNGLVNKELLTWNNENNSAIKITKKGLKLI